MPEKAPSFKEDNASIIVLDALGIKGVWKSSNIKNFMKEWSLLIEFVRNSLEELKTDEKIESSLYAFSDTIIIAIKGNDVEQTLTQAGILASTMIEYGIFVGVYLRGCISIGTVYEYGNMILGPAVDESAENYQKSNWIGAFVTTSAHSVLLRTSNQNDKKIHRYYLEYDIPTKTGIIKTWAVPLFNKLEGPAKTIAGDDSLVNFIHKKIEKADDIDGLEKWKNTLDFLYYIENEIKSK